MIEAISYGICSVMFAGFTLVSISSPEVPLPFKIGTAIAAILLALLAWRCGSLRLVVTDDSFLVFGWGGAKTLLKKECSGARAGINDLVIERPDENDVGVPGVSAALPFGQARNRVRRVAAHLDADIRQARLQ